MDIEKPRPHSEPAPETIPSVPEIGPIPARIDLNRIFGFREALDILEHTGFHSGPRARRKGYHLAAWSWLASFIDALILVSISCIFLVVFSWVMQTGAGSILRELRTETSLAENFLQVFVLSSGIYMISLRVLMGSTIGEWACDLRIGRLQDRLQHRYALQVILRETLIIATGVITLPLLSLIFGRDLAGKVSGAKLFSLK